MTNRQLAKIYPPELQLLAQKSHRNELESALASDFINTIVSELKSYMTFLNREVVTLLKKVNFAI